MKWEKDVNMRHDYVDEAGELLGRVVEGFEENWAVWIFPTEGRPGVRVATKATLPEAKTFLEEAYR